jgi:hypothetical protein
MALPHRCGWVPSRRGWRPWKTTAVAFPHDFWLVAGTAAPVVALAAVVSLGDALKESASSESVALRWWRAGLVETTVSEMAAKPDLSTDQPGINSLAALDEFTKDSKSLANALVVVGLFNLVLQAALLAFSLVSLLNDSNVVPPWFAITAAVGGLLLLAIAALGAVSLRATRMRALSALPRSHPADVEDADPAG